MNHQKFSQGAEIRADGVHYRIWAPNAQAAVLEISAEAQGPTREIVLAEAAGGFFHAHDKLGRAGDRYKIRLDANEGLPDPTSRWQPEGVHGPSMVIDPSTYVWGDGSWKAPHFRDLVIYELHVGAFTPEGTFRAAIEKLPHVRDCGATAIELMPIGDFAGGRNWGYDGVYLFAPTHAYGHPDDLRALVDAAHQLGLAVILDVVYNHFGPDGNYLHAYVGEYLDESKKTPWGGAIRYAEPDFKPLREMVVANPGYWMSEFHIDGFRLDATHAIMDDSPRHILQELTAEIHARGGFAIAEDARNDSRVITPEAEGGLGFDGVWADDFHHVVRVANTHENESYLADFAGSLSEAVETLQHGWLYRGQFSKSVGEPRGTDCAHVNPAAFVHCISNHDQTGNHAFGERLAHRMLPTALRAAEALICLSPYMPMLFMGQEWAATTPFLFFTDHNPDLGKLILEGRREEFKHFSAFNEPAVLEKIPDPQKPSSFFSSKLVWEEKERAAHAATLELYRACLRLRASDSAFRPATRETWRVAELAMGVGAIRWDSGDSVWILLFDLHGEHSGDLRREALFQGGELEWELILSTNESRFGGQSVCAVNVDTMTAEFKTAESVVLRGSPRRLQ